MNPEINIFTSTSYAPLQVIAFYLPQFHPIPENDLWWGKGFTEWTNVTRATPLFKGHYQPHLPSDLGFYDLRLPEVRTEQASLAKNYGISGFCYYHYWFNGERLLERPFDEVLSSGKPEFPFCLCWANEDWTSVWDGRSGGILKKQLYSKDDDVMHIRWLLNAFSDKRYITFEGKPLFLVYRASKLPYPEKTAAIWREEALRSGIGEIYLCKVESMSDERTDPRAIGFDAAVEFQPDWIQLGKISTENNTIHGKWKYRQSNLNNHRIYDYNKLIQKSLNKSFSYPIHRCVTPSWDNTARRQSDAVILIDSNPDAYGEWLTKIIMDLPYEKKGSLLFVNAWNEWAEGNHLEPCQKWGTKYLEATLRAVRYQDER